MAKPQEALKILHFTVPKKVEKLLLWNFFSQKAKRTGSKVLIHPSNFFVASGPSGTQSENYCIISTLGLCHEVKTQIGHKVKTRAMFLLCEQNVHKMELFH